MDRLQMAGWGLYTKCDQDEPGLLSTRRCSKDGVVLLGQQEGAVVEEEVAEPSVGDALLDVAYLGGPSVRADPVRVLVALALVVAPYLAAYQAVGGPWAVLVAQAALAYQVAQGADEVLLPEEEQGRVVSEGHQEHLV